MNSTRSDRYHPETSGVRRRITRSGLASVLAIICTVAMMANALAANGNATYCYDSTSNIYYISTGGANPPKASPYWYAQYETNGYTLQGIKGNISTAGRPYTFDNANQHVDAYLSANEQILGKWIQTGWHIGQISYCNGSSQGRNALEVYIEIFDDTSTSSDCTIGIVTSAPSIASYDTRYYATVSDPEGTRYRYQIYFEVPGSGNIQDLGWGDYKYLLSSETAAGETYAQKTTSTWPMCPVLGQTPSNDWDYFGQQASQSTFAAELELYNNGSWSDWTSSVPTTPIATLPYQLQTISNYTEFKVGGGQE